MQRERVSSVDVCSGVNCGGGAGQTGHPAGGKVSL